MEAKTALVMLRKTAVDRQNYLFEEAEKYADEIIRNEFYAKGRTYYEFISTIDAMLKVL